MIAGCPERHAHAYHQQEHEYSAPAHPVGHETAHNRAERRCDTVDRSHYGHKLGKLTSHVDVGGNRGGKNHRPTGAESLEQTAHYEKYYIARKKRYGRCNSKNHQRDQKHRLAAVAVAGRAPQHRAEAHTGHGHGKAHLRHRRCGMKFPHHIGNRGKIHIVYQRGECADNGYEHHERAIVPRRYRQPGRSRLSSRIRSHLF